jgi:energy-coupling factor transporter ATP-binding protein EcfA2
MSVNIITIKNCNNITEGKIEIQENKLNILFGYNGTGKSTIARAIYNSSSGGDLNDLIPYGFKSEERAPSLEGLSFGKIVTFNEEYVDKYIFKPQTLIDDTFEVLIRSEQFDEAKEKVDEALSEVKTTITSNEDIVTLKKQVQELTERIKLTSQDEIARRGGARGVLDGKGAFLIPLNHLRGYSRFLRRILPPSGLIGG